MDVNIMKACCCCLRLRRAPLMDLRTPHTYLGNLEIFRDMLKECFNLQIVEGGEESGICNTCVSRLRDATAFRRQVQCSQAELKAFLDSALQKDDRPVKSEPLDDESEKDGMSYEGSMGMPVKREDGVKKDFLLRKHLRFTDEGHVKSETLEGDNKENDMLTALSTFATSPTRLQRLRADDAPYATITKESSDNTTSLTDETYSCNTSGTQFTRKTSLMEHAQKHVMGATYCCNTCSEKFSSESLLVKHAQAGMCTKKTAQSSMPYVGIHTRIGEKPYKCETWAKTIIHTQARVEHKQIRTRDKLFTCEICDLKFGQKSTLRKHKQRHTSDKPYSCEICNLQFGRKSTLRKHKQLHTGDKPYRCAICNQSFTQFDALTKHTITHSDLIFYGCGKCPMKFTNKKNQERHEKSHKKDKPFSCAICKMKFKHERNLTKHKKVHLKIKPYSCEKCKRKFKQFKSLDRHKKKKHKASEASIFNLLPF